MPIFLAENELEYLTKNKNHGKISRRKEKREKRSNENCQREKGRKEREEI